MSFLARTISMSARALTSAPRARAFSHAITAPRVFTPKMMKEVRMLATDVQSDVEARVLKIVKAFERVDPAKVTLNAHFLDVLGLDSLDAVEIVMAFEDEFGLTIAENDAATLLTAEKAVQYVLLNQGKASKQ